VASNVLKHGTGALNIGASRIKAETAYEENTVTQGGDHFSVGSPDKTRGTTFAPSSEGRWPPNLILQHLSGCQRIGVVKVPGNRIDTRPGGDAGREDKSQWRFRPTDATRRGYSDPDGMETVDTWACAPGCPVPDMDDQIGMQKSPSTYTRTARAEGSWLHAKEAGTVQRRFGDAGGVSRFFKQVQEGEDV